MSRSAQIAATPTLISPAGAVLPAGFLGFLYQLDYRSQPCASTFSHERQDLFGKPEDVSALVESPSVERCVVSLLALERPADFANASPFAKAADYVAVAHMAGDSESRIPNASSRSLVGDEKTPLAFKESGNPSDFRAPVHMYKYTVDAAGYAECASMCLEYGKEGS